MKLFVIVILLFSYTNINNANSKHFKINETVYSDFVLDSIIEIESGNKNIAGLTGDVGVLQITKIFVDDVNRILGYKKFKYVDRWNKNKSIDMYYIVQRYYNPTYDFKIACYVHHRATSGKENLKYFNKVKTKAMQLILTNAIPEHKQAILSYIGSADHIINHNVIEVNTRTSQRSDISYINSKNGLSISIKPTMLNIPKSLSNIIKYLL